MVTWWMRSKITNASWPGELVRICHQPVEVRVAASIDRSAATSARGQLPELWSAYARLLPKGTAAVSEWQRLSNSHAALH
jgi:hypothetical protein